MAQVPTVNIAYLSNFLFQLLKILIDIKPI